MNIFLVRLPNHESLIAQVAAIRYWPERTGEIMTTSIFKFPECRDRRPDLRSRVQLVVAPFEALFVT